MGNKKLSKEEQDRNDDLRNAHERLKQNVTNLKTARRFVTDSIMNPAFAMVLGKFEKDIANGMEELVTVPKADVEKLQAKIIVGRQLVGTLKHAYESDLNEAERAVKEFEEQNPLFVKQYEKDNEVAAETQRQSA